MPFQKGQGGRPKGAVNKTTAKAKEAFQLAFERLGGIDRLVKWANGDPDNLRAFYSLYSKLIPVDVTSGEKELPALTINVPPLPDGGPQP